MEIYRTLHGPFLGCPSHKVLQKMYQIALPKLPVDDIRHASLEVLSERDSKMFFPRTELLEVVLDEDTIREVLDCKGESCCGHAREKNLANFPVLVTWVSNHARILLAVLIYLGHTTWINTFRAQNIGDNNLDKATSFISKLQHVESSLAFANFYEKTLDLFRPPRFVMGNPKFTYDDNQRFPYINDRECGKGSFGKVRRFEIHPDYLDDSLAKIARKYSTRSALAENALHPPAVFARKVLKYTVDESQFEMEEQVLRIIDAQRHNNIIDLVAFYTWRGELNCVFPFVELTLYDVLHTNWKPEHMAAPARFPKHWLWQQMKPVADGLQTIHNPPKQLWPQLGFIVGFHFDLKPQNILVTPDGILKITDFGQSMVKMVDEKEYAYGTYVGGDFAYGPPEVAPTRNEIKELVLPPSLQSSRQLPDPPTPPLTVSRQASSATSHMSSSDRKRSSTKSIKSPIEALREFEFGRTESFATSVFAPSSTSSEVPRITATANYDVWSLACIMTEVLAFIFEGGAEAVKSFEALRRGEGRDLCFHKGTQDRDCLKPCVRKKLQTYRALNHPDATFTLGQPRSYLSDVVGLVEEMFITNPARRVSSADVVSKLIIIESDHEESIDPNADILRFMRNLGQVGGDFKELGYWQKDGIVPFYNMADIKLETNDNSVVECRLQLFRKPGAVHVRIRYGDQFMKDDSRTFDTNDSFFCPTYLFDRFKRRVCCLKDKHHRRIFHFGSDADLMTFQAAIMRQQARRGIRVSEVELQPTNRSNETYKGLHDPNKWGRCQVWQAESPQYVTGRSSLGPSSPQQSTGPIHVLFFSPTAFFGVPLQDGKKVIREQQDLINERPKKLVFEKQRGFVQHFHYIKADVAGHRSARDEPLSPAMPLNSAWLKFNDSQRANKVEIHFPSHMELSQFKQEIMKANKENPYKMNEIPWKDASAQPAHSPTIFKSHTFK